VDRVLFAPRELPPLRLDAAQDVERYDAWVRSRERERAASSAAVHEQKRLLHVVMVVDGQPPAATVDSLRSLGRQQSTLWRLTVVAEEPWCTDITALLNASEIRQPFEVVTRELDSGFNRLLECGLASATHDDLALMFPGDVWADDAVSTLSLALEEGGIAYADEDCLSPEGMHYRPRLKPEFSPEFALHADLIGRPLALWAGLASHLTTGSAEETGSRDHDLALRAVEAASSVRHIAEVLCHRLIPPAVPLGRQHISAALARRDEDGVVGHGSVVGTVHIVRSPSQTTKASIIIPFRDEPHFLRSCFDSIERTKGQITVEYLLVDNGSTQPETLTLLDRLGSVPRVHILTDTGPFNWARLNNAAALRASGDVLVFLNNDIEARASGWLDALCAQAARNDVGAVGARLLYPDGRLQHCGVVLGMGGAAGHLLKGLDPGDAGYMTLAVTTRECSAVTGACLASRRTVFEQHEGFDETLGVDLNDIDYCLRLQRFGLRVLYEAAAELVHHESPSRGTAGDPSDIVRFLERWEKCVTDGDPYLSPHITRLDSSCALRDTDEEQRWQSWYAGLREG
jgi:GT2 family glycosyltransferase